MSRSSILGPLIGIVLALSSALNACGGGSGAADADTDSDADTDTDSDTDTVEMREDLDVAYTPPPGGDPTMALLDVYHVPDGAPKRLMVFVHGGSWVGGDKSNLGTAAALIRWFIDRGYTVAAPNFRLASPRGEALEIRYSDQLADVASALSWLEANRATYGVTLPGVVLVGYSSGAHLVALLAADEQYLQSVGLSVEHLAAVISLDVHAYDVPYALQLMAGSELQGNIPLIEHLFGATEAEQLIGSPVSYIEQTALPPSLLVSADPSAEPTSKGYIAFQATRRYAGLLVAAGHAATSVHFDDETHSSLVLDFGTSGDGPTEAVAAFLDSAAP